MDNYRPNDPRFLFFFMRLITFVLLQQVWKVGLIKTECNLCPGSCSGSSIVNILTSWDSLSCFCTAKGTLILNITQTGYKRSHKSYHNRKQRPWKITLFWFQTLSKKIWQNWKVGGVAGGAWPGPRVSLELIENNCRHPSGAWQPTWQITRTEPTF